MTLWEDRPRLNLFEKQMTEKRRQRQEEKERGKKYNQFGEVKWEKKV